MKENIKFHLDENVQNAIAEGLRKQGIDVTTTPEEGLIGISDEEQIAFILQKKRIIFTHDADFLRIHQQGIKHTGIIYSRQGRHSIGQIILFLVLIWQSQTYESMINHVEFI
jgi:predicted nuclease of predicted toxin-antitoxin system